MYRYLGEHDSLDNKTQTMPPGLLRPTSLQCVTLASEDTTDSTGVVIVHDALTCSLNDHQWV